MNGIQSEEAEALQRRLDQMSAQLQSVLSRAKVFEPIGVPEHVLTALGFGTARVDGWVRMCELLEQALKDELIKNSKPALSFLDIIHELAANYLPRSDDDGMQVFEPLLSFDAAEKARRRHAPQRDAKLWVPEA